ncbi:MAG: phosphatase PAP2 family protein [Pseudomonadota bacterium]
MTSSLGGCVSPGGTWSDNIAWPGSDDLSQAFRDAATDPHTWVPLVAAGALVAADVDEQWSEDLADEQPLFGSDAEDTSDTLRDVATGAYVLTALLAPSESAADKFRGLSLGAGTMVVDGIVNQGLKDLSGRERPDGSNDESFPSGHASKAASRTNMAIRNLQHMQLPQWASHTTSWGLRGVAFATGLARVEARKHHLSDVLAGYAFGNFVANFMERAFNNPQNPQVAVRFAAVEEGGALTFTFAID